MIALDFVGGCSCSGNAPIQDLFKIYSGNVIPKNKLCDGLENFMNNTTYTNDIVIKEINPLQLGQNTNCFNYGSFNNVSLYLNDGVSLNNFFNGATINNLYIKGGNLSNIGNMMSFNNLVVECNGLSKAFENINIRQYKSTYLGGLTIKADTMFSCLNALSYSKLGDVSIKCNSIVAVLNSCKITDGRNINISAQSVYSLGKSFVSTISNNVRGKVEFNFIGGNAEEVFSNCVVEHMNVSVHDLKNAFLNYSLFTSINLTVNGECFNCFRLFTTPYRQGVLNAHLGVDNCTNCFEKVNVSNLNVSLYGKGFGNSCFNSINVGSLYLLTPFGNLVPYTYQSCFQANTHEHLAQFANAI